VLQALLALNSMTAGSLNAQTDQKVAYVAQRCHLVNFRFPCSIINLQLKLNENLINTFLPQMFTFNISYTTGHRPLAEREGWS